MLNPDGVIVGNSRCSLAARDLNRQFKHTSRDLCPTVWHVKQLLRRLMEERGVALFCDFHGHSRRNNAFLYGCESKRSSTNYLSERVFPFLLTQSSPDLFDWEACTFNIHRCKEGTARAVVWSLGVKHSYTLEVSQAGTNTIGRPRLHFGLSDLLQLGRQFLLALLDFTDPAVEKIENSVGDPK